MYRILAFVVYVVLAASEGIPLGEFNTRSDSEEGIFQTEGTQQIDQAQPILTIFSTLKPNIEEEVKRRQRYSIASWTNLKPKPNIILFGDETGTEDLAKEYGALYVPKIDRHPEFAPMPLLNSMFAKAKELSTTPLLMYVNADIVFPTKNFTDSVDAVMKELHSQEYMIVGMRFDVVPNYGLPHPSPSEQLDRPPWLVHMDRAFQYARSSWAERHNDRKWAIDFFMYTRNFWDDIPIPPFLLGVQTFDNWLVHIANKNGKNVVDVTETMVCFHQNHEFTHATERKKRMKEYNMKLAEGGWHLGNVDRTNYKTTRCGNSICVKRK